MCNSSGKNASLNYQNVYVLAAHFQWDGKLLASLILTCERRLPQNKKRKQLLEIKVNSSDAKKMTFK